MNRERSGQGKRESGQSLVEMTLVLAVSLLLLLGIVDFGRISLASTSLTAAAQRAARVGTITSNSDAIATAARTDLIMVDPAAVTVVVTRNSTFTQVDLTFIFEPITPFIGAALGRNQITLTRSARVAVLGSGS